MKTDPIRSLIDLHTGVMASGFNYAYFELARTRATDWMAWLCTNARELDPARLVFATGQGTTPDEACLRAISSFVPQVHAAWNAGKITSQQAEQLSDLVRFPSDQTQTPYAYCCNGDPATCDCVNPDHGTARQNNPILPQMGRE